MTDYPAIRFLSKARMEKAKYDLSIHTELVKALTLCDFHIQTYMGERDVKYLKGVVTRALEKATGSR